MVSSLVCLSIPALSLSSALSVSPFIPLYPSCYLPSPSQPPEVERAKDPDVFSPPIRLSLKLHACTASPACRRSSGGAASVTPPPLEVEVAPPQHLRLHRRVWSSVPNPFKVTARWTWICYRDDWLLPRWFGWSSFKPEDLRSLLLYYI